MVYSDSIHDVYTEHINNSFFSVNYFFLEQQLNYWVIGLVCYEKCPAVPRKGERPINQFNHKSTQFTFRLKS